jgi:polar amino acid transport system substrate-binding protein
MNPLKTASRLSVASVLLALFLVAAAWWSIQGAGAVPARLDASVLHVGLDSVPPPAAGAKVRTLAEPSGHIARLLSARNQVALSVRSRPDAAGESPFKQPDLILTYSGSLPTLVGDQIPVHTLVMKSRPQAIMRSDTDISSWDDLAGRSVCVSEPDGHKGYAVRYGAREKVYPATADALLGLRTGQCDAVVIESTLASALLTLPEWKKFSATLPPGQGRDLIAIIQTDRPGADELLHRQLLELASERNLNTLYAGLARDIAFEVYLDQVVEDCH